MKVNRPSCDVIIPARNEEENIGKVLDIVAFHRLIRRVYVMVDGDTIDQTVNVASPYEKVEVITTSIRGKGQLVKYGLRYVATSRVIFLDADIQKLYPEHIDILTAGDLATMTILVPQIPNNLSEFTVEQQRRMLWAWPYVSGQRAVPAAPIRQLDLHGYLMETQINQLAERLQWSVFYQPTLIESPVKLTTQRMIEMERDREWGHKNGIL